MITMQLQLIVVLISLVLFIEIIHVDGRLFCFRRLKRKGKCGGLVRRNKYSNPEECCAKRGQGFADIKIKFGRNRFRCTPCSELQPRLSVTSPAPSTTTTTTTPLPVRPRSVSESTTEFSWPVPAGRYKPSERGFSYSDGRPVVEWEEWSPCSVTCGAGWRSRAKVCDDCDRNDYENVQSQPCMNHYYCPVEGSWGPWYPWNSCSTTCSSGTRQRTRKCNYPPPAYGGADCPGDAVAVQECGKKPCPVDGTWGEWGEFSTCTSSCGPGTMRRSRSCDSPLPQHGGKDCQGPDSQVKRCELTKCPVNGGWSLWTTWALCSATCGQGKKVRSRSCDSPKPQHGGEECEGSSVDEQQCYGGRPCPVDGGWSEWTNYGYCRAPRCGRGFQVRSRKCTKPRPSNGGKPCLGQQYEHVSCKDDLDCPKNGTWCEWTKWNQCSSTCGEDSPLQARQRKCACPPPRNGGEQCQGESFQVRDCVDVPVCDPMGLKAKRPTNVTAQATGSSTVAIFWDQVFYETHPSVVTYRVVGDQYHMKQVICVTKEDAFIQTCPLKDLEPNTNYSISVQAFNKHGSSDKSETVFVQTMSDDILETLDIPEGGVIEERDTGLVLSTATSNKDKKKKKNKNSNNKNTKNNGSKKNKKKNNKKNKTVNRNYKKTNHKDDDLKQIEEKDTFAPNPTTPLTTTMGLESTTDESNMTQPLP